MNLFTITDYRNSSALDIVSSIRSGQVSKEEVINFAYQIIEETDDILNNIVSLVDKDVAIEYGRDLEDKGQTFYGVPLLIKGLGHAIEGANNSLAIDFLKDEFYQETNEFVQSLIDAGFIIIGQTTYPQFGWLNVTVSKLFGSTANPWNIRHNAGGSSGGAAAAVASGQVPIATTSDAGGSTRIPASWSGLIGLHPSRGVLMGNEDNERNQTSHFAVTKSIEDLTSLFKCLLRPSYSLSESVLDNKIRFAYTLATPAGTPLDPEAKTAVLNTVKHLKKAGFQVSETDYPIDGRIMMEAYYIIAANNAKDINALAQYKLNRDLTKEDVELITWGLYQTGLMLTPEDISEAWQFARKMEEDLEIFYQNYDILITPTTATSAPEVNYYHLEDQYKDAMEDMSALNKKERLDLIYQQWLPAWIKTPYTQMANLTGTPSLSLPIHLTPDNLPIGVLFNSKFGEDYLLLEVGKFFEGHDLLQVLRN